MGGDAWVNIQEIVLDIDKRSSNQRVVVRQGDKAGTTIRAIVYDHDVAVSDTWDAVFCMELPDKAHFVEIDAGKLENGVINYTVDESKIAPVSGISKKAYFELRKDDVVMSTANFQINVLDDAESGNEKAGSYVSRLDAEFDAFMDESETKVDDAAAKADTAASTATDAAEKADTAAEKADTAASTATDAAEKADTAAEKADTAAEKADTAAEKADTAASTATDAAEKADTAAAKADTAAEKADTAAAKADTAASTATDAAEKADTAAAKADTAASTATDAAEKAEEAANKTPTYDSAKGRYDNASIKTWLAAQADGKAYGVSIPKSAATGCTKTGANSGIANPVPGIIGRPAVDPYVGKGAFRFYEVNGGVDADGTPYVTAIRGDGLFSRTASDVWIMTPVLYWNFSETSTTVELSVSDTKLAGMSLQPKATLPSGTVRPYMLYAKYPLSVDASGAARTVSGLQTRHFVSYNSLIDITKSATTGYSAKSVADDWYLKTMFLLKYGTKNTQSVFTGCVGYTLQCAPTVAESGKTRVVISKANADQLVVGSSVMLGTHANGSTDRGAEDTHDVVDAATILRMEAYDSSNVAVYLDVSKTFDTKTTYLLSTCAWRAGACDGVEGDGSPLSNTDSKEPFVLQGIETMCGSYETMGDVALKNTGSGWKVMVAKDSAKVKKDDATTGFAEAATYPGGADESWNYGLYPAPVSGLLLQQGTGGSTSAGICDGNFKNADTATGMREWRSLGALGGGGDAGLWFVLGSGALGSAWWYSGSRLSATGRGGEAA
jgi:hypothetical protein